MRKENSEFYESEARRLHDYKAAQQAELYRVRQLKDQQDQAAKKQYEYELLECAEYKSYQQKLEKYLFYYQLKAKNDRLALQKAESEHRAKVIMQSSVVLSSVEKPIAESGRMSVFSDYSCLHTKNYDELKPMEFVKREIDFSKMITNGSLLLHGEKQLIEQLNYRVRSLNDLEKRLDKEEIRLQNSYNRKEEQTMLSEIQMSKIDELKNYLLTKYHLLEENLMVLLELIKIETLQLESHLKARDLTHYMAQFGVEGVHYEAYKLEYSRARTKVADYAAKLGAQIIKQHYLTKQKTTESGYRSARAISEAARLKSRTSVTRKELSREYHARANPGEGFEGSYTAYLKIESFTDGCALLRNWSIIQLAQRRIGSEAAGILGINTDLRAWFYAACDSVKSTVDVDLEQEMHSKAVRYAFPFFYRSGGDSYFTGAALNINKSELLAQHLKQQDDYAQEFESFYCLLALDNTMTSEADRAQMARTVLQSVFSALSALYQAIGYPMLFFESPASCVERLTYLKNKQVDAYHNRQVTVSDVYNLSQTLDAENDTTLIEQMRAQIAAFEQKIRRLRIEIQEIYGFYRRIDKTQYKSELEFQSHVKLLRTCNAYFNIDGIDYTLAKSEDLDSYTGSLSKYYYLKQITLDRQDEANTYIEHALYAASITSGIMSYDTKDGMLVISYLQKLDKLFDNIVQELARFDVPTLRSARRYLLRKRRKELEDYKCSLLNYPAEIDVEGDTWYETLYYTKSAMERKINDPKRVTTLEKTLIAYYRDLQAKVEEESFYY